MNSPFGPFLRYLYSRPRCQVRQVFPLSLLAPPTFKCAFYQLEVLSGFWKEHKLSNKTGSSFSTLLLYIVTIVWTCFPLWSSTTFVLMGLLKLVPRYPLTQHWAPSQSTARNNAWQQFVLSSPVQQMFSFIFELSFSLVSSLAHAQTENKSTMATGFT